MNTLAIFNPSSVQAFEPDYRQYFDLERAYQELLNHIRQLPSMLNDPSEQHTMRQYPRNCRAFIDFLDNRQSLPDENLIREYIAHLRHARGLKSTTLTAYLAPVRLFCKFLASQTIAIPLVKTEDVHQTLLKMQLEMGIERQRTRILAAAAVPNPRPDFTTHQPQPKARWISEDDFNKILHRIDPDTLVGKRDRAILLLAYWTGLRRAAIRRMTLANFTRQTSRTYSIDVMDKRRNSDPIACPKFVYDAVIEYVEAYNDAAGILPITPTSPLWRRFHKSGAIYPSDLHLSSDAIYRVVSRVSESAGIRIATHDLRRSTITNAIENGMPATYTSEQVRHSSLDTTMCYKKRSTNFDALNLASYSPSLHGD